MGHDVRDTMKYYYWLTLENSIHHLTAAQLMKHDCFFYILRYGHFNGNMNQPNKNDNNYDKLWKMRTLFDQLHDANTKF